MGNEHNSYYLPKNVQEKLKNKEQLKKELASGEIPQNILDFSNETMANFYKISYHYFENKNFKEAANAFLFLAHLNPHIADYWIGLGMSTQMCHEYEAAIDAYEIASSLEIDNPVPYFYLAKCLFAIHERENALQALDLAIEVADEIEEYQELKTQAEAAKLIILEKYE